MNFRRPLAAKDVFFWAWPMTNIYNRRLKFQDLPHAGLMGGTVPVGPPNRLSMLSDYITPDERQVACPNQDVVYGFMLLALDQSPIVVQVPDFGDRFWVYQVVDLRTDGFADFGKMYGTKPGFYLLVGPDWKGTVPKGITKVFRASSNTGVLIPRVFQDDTREDKKQVQVPLSGVNAYPLSEYTGKMQPRDWAKLPRFPAEFSGDAETRWVYQDLDGAGGRLNGANKYTDTVTFPKGALPPVRGFWSLTLYNQHHFFADNALKRFSLGTKNKNKNLKPNSDGSLTLYVQPDSPGVDQESNWLPAPKGEDFSLYIRTYWPQAAVLSGAWTPPPVGKVQ